MINLIKNQKGLSLIQALLAIGIVSIFVGAFCNLLINLQKEVRNSKDKQDRVLTSYEIDQILLSSQGIKVSADLLPENSALKACVKGGAIPGCTSNCCKNAETTGFFLLDPRDQNPDIQVKTRLAGPESAPVKYNHSSQICTTQDCFYSTTTTFTAHCPGDAPNCDHAEHLVISIKSTPVPGNESRMKEQKRSLIYFVNLNYQPSITPIADQSLGVGESRTLSVYGNAGHPSEVQNFIFETCLSADATIAKVTCYGFMNGVGTIVVEGKAAGTTQINLVINDAGGENQLSAPTTFSITVPP